MFMISFLPISAVNTYAAKACKSAIQAAKNNIMPIQ